jgi:hypothetical protein
MVDSGAATPTRKWSNARMQTCEDDRKEPTECKETVEAEHVEPVEADKEGRPRLAYGGRAKCH